MGISKPVLVIQLPQMLRLGQVQSFLKEFSASLKADRAQIVLDFSQVESIDSAGVDMLLTCLEEVSKRDGDLKLAAVSPQSAVILELTRVDRIFEIFDSSEEAVESFRGFPTPSLPPDLPIWYTGPALGPGEGNDLKPVN